MTSPQEVLNNLRAISYGLANEEEEAVLQAIDLIEEQAARIKELETEVAQFEAAYNTAADRASYEMRRANDAEANLAELSGPYGGHEP